MLSYLHAFHAGNEADIIKHFCLFETLRYFNRKEKPYFYIDTHSGSALYNLSGSEAQKTGESLNGILKFENQSLCGPLQDFFQHYQKIVNKHYYPGSPLWAKSLMRQEDFLRLFEKHPTEFTKLQKNTNTWKNCIISNKDGFSGLIAQLPPPTHRAVVLIDPSYEIISDYKQVIQSVEKSLKRFATGCYLIWYPCLNKPESQRFPEDLRALSNNFIQAELWTHRFSKEGFGMAGSGMWIINPPFELDKTLQIVLPQWVKILGKDDSAHFVLNMHIL